MADYNLNAEITADASGFEAGIKKAQKASKNLSKSVSSMVQGLGKNGLVGALGAVGLATGGVTAIIGTARKAFQAISKTVNECAEAYRNQYKAEVALETAVKNNPYIDGSSLNSLKQFAGEMQKVSEIGDEQFLPMMAQLIATGRTEAETMDIIRVATDMSATGTMSFETAVQQLSATLNGNIGRLGQQNSELKNLTEEELKSGKAVEILGNKFKGLAEATADTSKQLKNALGDLKENLGRIFETALAPMRKFFTEVISNLNDVLKKSADVKKAMKDVFSEENINIEAPTDSLQVALDEVLKKQREVTANYSQYIQLYGKYIDQTTDETVKVYKEQISDLNKQIKTLSEELIKRRKESDAQAKARKEAEASAEEEKQINDLKEKYLKLIAEQEAKWANIKKVTGEAVKNEERLKFYQDQLVAIMTESGGKITENNQYYKDQMAIIQGILAEIGNPEKQTEWANKLLDQRIEMLETERDKAMQYAEEEGQETYSIWIDYNNKILELKLERLEKEKEKALAEEGLTAEDKIKIEEYYKNETQKIYNELGNYKKKKNEEEKKDEKSKFTKMLEMVKQYAENVKKVFSKIASTIKNVFSVIGNIFNKALDIFSFNPDDALTNLLKVEDAILTFFVETLPKLPSFFASAIQSIIILVETFLNAIDWEKVQEILNSIIDTIVKNAPTIVETLLNLVLNIAQTLLNAIIHFVESGGWKMLLDMILKIQKRIEQFVVDNINEVVQTIIDMLPDLIQFLIDSIVSASKTLGKLFKPILTLIVKLIEAIVDVAFSDEVIDASMGVIEDFITAIIEVIIELLPKILPKIIGKLLKVIVRSLISFPIEIAKAFIQGLSKAFTQTNWGQVVKDMFEGFIEGVKNFFGIHSPSTVFENFGQYMIEGLWNGIKNMGQWLNENVGNFFTNMINGISQAFNNVGGGIQNVFSNIWNSITNVFGNVGNWFSNIFTQAVNGIRNAFNGIGEWFRSLWEGFANAMKTPINSVISGINEMITQMNKISVTIPSWVPAIGGRTFGINLSKLNYLATGTQNAQKGLAIVGEAGPELVKFNGGEQVLNNRNTNKAIAEAGKSTNNFNVTFNNLQDTTAFAMMQQLKQYNRSLAINGVI